MGEYTFLQLIYLLEKSDAIQQIVNAYYIKWRHIMNIPIIKIRNLVKKYNDRVVFDNVSLDIMKGESIALTGNNGMGNPKNGASKITHISAELPVMIYLMNFRILS